MPWQQEQGIENKTNSINGLVRASQSEEKYSGSIDEALEKTIRVFNSLARMCDLNEIEKLQAVPVILKADAVDFFAETDY